MSRKQMKYMEARPESPFKIITKKPVTAGASGIKNKHKIKKCKTEGGRKEIKDQ